MPVDKFLAKVKESLSGILEPHQRASLEREGDRVWLNLDNMINSRGIRVGPCAGCPACDTSGVQHLEFTPYTLKRVE